MQVFLNEWQVTRSVYVLCIFWHFLLLIFPLFYAVSAESTQCAAVMPAAVKSEEAVGGAAHDWALEEY